MHLAWVEVRGFRSYDHLALEPDPETNVFVGSNGAGKTNFLEAVGYLARLKSFRGAPDEALLAADADRAIVRGGFLRDAGELRVEIELPRQGRRVVLLNGKRPQRHSDLKQQLQLVAFLPDDLDLVKRGPSLRRDYLDDLAEQLWPAAGAEHEDFAKALRQRNALLRQSGRETDPVTLGVWDQRLGAAGAKVTARRLQVLERLGPLIDDAYRRLGGAAATVTWTYRSKWLESATELEASLARALQAAHRYDMDRRVTTVGPHRDEPVFFLHGRDARVQASQGEQRSLALGLRIAAYHLLREQHGEPPLLILDDVFSELDARRSAGVLELLPAGQVFISTAREEEVPVSGRRWAVGGGTIS
jgi:DNA replication and repair protein RecF